MDIGSLTGAVTIEDQLTGKLTEIAIHVKEFATDFDGAMGMLAHGVEIAGVAIVGMAASIVALGEKGSKINEVSSALDHFAGSAEAAEEIVAKMRAGAQGTVGDFDLMKDATRVLSAGVKLNADQFGELTQAAFVLKNRGLGPTSEMMDLISSAMITGRTRALAMKLGVVDVKDSTEAFAASLGVETSQLSAAGQAEGKRIGIMQMLEAANKDAGVAQRDFGEQLEYARARIENWTDDLASAVAASPAVMEALNSIGNALSTAFGGDGKTLMDVIIAGVNNFARGVTAAVPYIVDFGRGIKNAWDFLSQFWPVVKLAAEAFVVYEGVLLLIEAQTVIYTAAIWLANTATLAYEATMAMAAGETATFGGALATALGPIGLITIAVVAMVETWKAASKESGWVRDLSDKFEYASLRLQGFSAEAANNAIALEHSMEATANHTKGLTDLQKAQEQVGSVMGTGIELENAMTGVDASLYVNKNKLTEAQKKYAEALKEYTSTDGGDYLKMIDQIGVSMYEGIAFDHARGKSTEVLAEIYKTTKGVVEDVVKSEQHYAEQVKLVRSIEATAFRESEDIHRKWAEAVSRLADSVGKHIIDGANEISTAQRRLADEGAAASMSSLDYQIAKIDEWADQTKKAFQGTKEQAAAYYAVIEAEAGLKTDNLYVNNKALQDNTFEALQAIADREATTYDQMAAAPWKFSKEAIAAQAAIYAKAQETALGIKDSYGAALGNLSDMFVKLGQVTGGSFGDVLGSIGKAVVQLEAAHKQTQLIGIDGQKLGGNFGALSTVFNDDAEATDRMAAGISVVGNVAQGVSNVMEATSTHATAAGNAMGGAMAGMQAGAFAGPWGMAVGAAAGFMVGLIRGKPEWAKVADEVGKDFGVKISDSLAKAIESGAADFGGSEQASAISHLSDIIKEAGGISKENLPQMSDRLHDVFSMIETHQMTITQGAKTLDENFSAFATAGTDKIGMLDAKLVGIIKLNDELGTSSKAIAQYVGQQSAGAASAFASALAVPANALKSYDDLNAKQMDLRLQMDKTTDSKTLAGLDAQLQEVDKQLDIVGVLYDTTRIKSQSTATAIGAALSGTFAGMIAGGASVQQALAAIEPAVKALEAQFVATGFNGGAAFDELRAQIALAHDEIAGPAIQSVNDMAAGMVALGNTGGMTTDIFAGFGDQVDQTFQALIAQGKDGGQVMIGMQPALQALWVEQQTFGYKVDDATQALIDEAEKAGIVGEKHKSSTDQMIDALGVLHTDLMGIVTALTGGGGVADAFQTLGSKAKAAIESIPTSYSLSVTENVTTVRDGGDGPNYAAQGGRVTSSGVSYYANGTDNVLTPVFVPHGTDTVPAELTPGETVTSEPDSKSQTESLKEVSAGIEDIRQLLAGQPAAMSVALKDALVLLPRRIA